MVISLGEKLEETKRQMITMNEDDNDYNDEEEVDVCWYVSMYVYLCINVCVCVCNMRCGYVCMCVSLREMRD